MATHRNRLVKIHLFEAAHINLLGSTIVGQNGDTIIIERPQPKPRAEAKRAVRKARATRTNAQPATDAVQANG